MARFLGLAAWFGLAYLALSACGEKNSGSGSGGGGFFAGTAAGKVDPAEKRGGLPAESLNADDSRELEEPEKSVAEALAGRWEARFATGLVVIELETSNGGLSGSVREPGRDPVRIEIGIVTADGLLFETRGDTRYIWIARLAGDVLSGRREKVANGTVEKFDGLRVMDTPDTPPSLGLAEK